MDSSNRVNEVYGKVGADINVSEQKKTWVSPGIAVMQTLETLGNKGAGAKEPDVKAPS